MQLRTYLLIDQMQPQYGALTGKTMQGEIPVEGMAEVYIETAPASDIYKVMDIALKTTDVRAGALAVEREYGSLEIHSYHQESVQVAGRQALDALGLTESDRMKPEILSALSDFPGGPISSAIDQPDILRRIAAGRRDFVCTGSATGGVHCSCGKRSGKGSEYHAGQLHPARAIRSVVFFGDRRGSTAGAGCSHKIDRGITRTHKVRGDVACELSTREAISRICLRGVFDNWKLDHPWR